LSNTVVAVTKPSSARRAWSVAVLVVAAAGLLASCTTGTTSGIADSPSAGTTVSAPPTTASSAPATTPTTTAPAKPKKVVKVTSLESDGATYGVGMPIVLYFSPLPTDSTAFVNAVKVTVDGQPVDGAWYWEQPDRDEVRRGVIEAHFRPKTTAPASSPEAYWPADSQIHVDIPIKGLSAGSTKKNDLVYSGKLSSLDYSIGDAHISTVNANTNNLQMKVTSNGKLKRTIPVSLGAAATPTYRGTKVVMQKGEDNPKTGKLRPNGTVMMSGPGYTNDPVQWSVRITQSGEYVHSAPWNGEIGARSTSNGCTNLHPADGKWFYNFSRIGDVVTYPNAPGPTMRPDDGLGDWNIPWATWALGGKLRNP
jgi:lipoprotein-anchoring transpeptidase ErfK/SrfK